MYATERQDLIEQRLNEDGRVSVIELAQSFDVTTETIRRDLAHLEGIGTLRRVHGGAVPRERASTTEPSLTDRLQRHGAAKSAIAVRALSALDTSVGSVYFDAGTTTGAVAARLASRSTGSPVEVVTHALTLAQVLAGVPGVSLSVIGGRIRGLTAAAVGSDTVRAIESLRPDVAFLGANGLSAGFGVSTPDPDEAAVKSAIVRAARRVVLVTDAEKLGRELLVSFAPLNAIDVLVTDAAPEPVLADALAEAGVEVWLA
ncbi:DeoR/GlpR family DNA-binding transcription regulator [Microbacterium sp. RU33B]|uniref:DeoR/GlpR family DNA-binding transcription regulator n=1 Tax=Microbacterium sp. RU33B TaxID=1907390 RepID=UPI0009698918|nr:DeoR/GlpR family DNA-binding transcription regulator [Microbacterium sp. RU33B]SIT72892.1 transcriptional regulator, DeoR family [Microbacterium sp. RU33B]